MPVSALWALVISLVGLALGLTYKWVENAHALKLADKETDRIRAAFNSLEETRKNEALSAKSEIDSLKETHNKEISDIKETHRAELEKIVTHNTSTVGSNPNMTETHKKILELLFQKPVNIEDVCKTFKLNREESNYYLYDLYNKEMAYPPVAYSSGRQEWRLSQEGREYVMIRRNSDQQKEK